MILAGGKRFRPNLLFTVVISINPMLLKNSFSVAYAIELLHTYSLIHDDLPAMDNADLRRGCETVHKTYNEVTAILAGDALNTYAFEILSNAPLAPEVIVELTQILSKAGGSGGMVLGQAIDCHFENIALDLKHLKFLHLKKTGVLIAASLKMGAVVANSKDSTKEELYQFGEKLGLLFQIKDDIIDATQSSKTAGKTTNNDDGKNSFVNLLGINGAKMEHNKLKSELYLITKDMLLPLKIMLNSILDTYFKDEK
jgi:farnesyl diphosphate synthase